MITGILPKRTIDPHGSGEYGAPRGSRLHVGIDFECAPGTQIQSPVHGHVTKIGYPYADDLAYRYVQITDATGHNHRVFYIQPLVEIGAKVSTGDTIGSSQDLTARYPGITPHCHYEIKKDGIYTNPEVF